MTSCSVHSLSVSVSSLSLSMLSEWLPPILELFSMHITSSGNVLLSFDGFLRKLLTSGSDNTSNLALFESCWFFWRETVETIWCLCFLSPVPLPTFVLWATWTHLLVLFCVWEFYACSVAYNFIYHRAVSKQSFSVIMLSISNAQASVIKIIFKRDIRVLSTSVIPRLTQHSQKNVSLYCRR